MEGVNRIVYSMYVYVFVFVWGRGIRMCGIFSLSMGSNQQTLLFAIKHLIEETRGEQRRRGGGKCPMLGEEGSTVCL